MQFSIVLKLEIDVKMKWLKPIALLKGVCSRKILFACFAWYDTKYKKRTDDFADNPYDIAVYRINHHDHPARPERSTFRRLKSIFDVGKKVSLAKQNLFVFGD